MSASEDIRTRKGKRARNGHEPPAPIDARTRRGVMIGGTIALICAAGLSFPSLYGLARTGGLPMWLAPLLPVSLDVYAYIAMWFADRVPTTHPARASALRNGWLALALTVACNFFDHFLTFAAAIISPLARDILLSTVLALPPFIVGRVLHLRALADGNGDTSQTPVADIEPDTPKKTTKPKADAKATPDTDAQAPANGTADIALNQTSDSDTPAPDTASDHPERSMPWWAEKAAPLYRQWIRDHNGTKPTAPMLADLLIKAGYDVPGGEVQRRKIRAATEAHITENPEAEPEPDRVGAAS